MKTRLYEKSWQCHCGANHEHNFAIWAELEKQELSSDKSNCLSNINFQSRPFSDKSNIRTILLFVLASIFIAADHSMLLRSRKIALREHSSRLLGVGVRGVRGLGGWVFGYFIIWKLQHRVKKIRTQNTLKSQSRSYELVIQIDTLMEPNTQEQNSKHLETKSHLRVSQKAI